MAGAKVCVVGSSNTDLTFRTPRLPRPGETLTGQAFCLGFGGKGANQAVAAARLGARVSMIARVGKDIFGEGAIRNFREEGIDTTCVAIDDRYASGVASIVVDDRAQNCIIVIPGANGALSPEDVQRAAPAITSALVLLCQMETPVESTLAAFRLAKAAGVRTILNPAPAARLPEELLRLTDLCVPNETEVETLTGLPSATPEQAEAAARALRSSGAGCAIVTLGSRGVVVVDEQGAEHLAAVAVNAVDPTGAGDAFIGGLGVFLAEGANVRDAARRANAVAALSVTRLGTQVAFPRRAEVEALLGRVGNAG